jgi:uncharacterized repeat protein (TIGR03803 family)
MTNQYPVSISRICVRTASTALAFVVVLGAIQPAETQTYTVLYTFTGGTDGANPISRLVRDKQGNLYGTTGVGGDLSCGGGGGCGTVFKLDTTGVLTTLWSFTGGADGQYAAGGLVRDSAGNLYGTTLDSNPGFGTVFKVDSTGHHTVLHTFTGPDGESPQADLIRDAAGNLYGTAQFGGPHGMGVVFKLDSAANYTVLYDFRLRDGNNPYAGLIRDSKGNLYGTTFGGGTGHHNGTVFKLGRTGHETILLNFDGHSGGLWPESDLIRDSSGNLYGTTNRGGNPGCVQYGCGTVFKLDSSGHETVLYAFKRSGDGNSPNAGLVRDAQGNLYGATPTGGPYYGTLFKIDGTGKETILYHFHGSSDGEYPASGLIRDAAGNLYGTAALGGNFNCNPKYGCGVVFKLVP